MLKSEGQKLQTFEKNIPGLEKILLYENLKWSEKGHDMGNETKGSLQRPTASVSIILSRQRWS